MNSLTIYRASAGSGKTFTLTIEYIKLLLANPGNFRNILAVTFTNKATEEMKMRILSQLYGLAAGLNSSDTYLNKIIEDTNYPKTFIRAQAREALTILLHNYHYFKVETIDTFFQSIFRNLARELDLTPNLKIDLNDESVKNEAVDSLIKLSGHDSRIRQQLMSYVIESINSDKGWDITEKIKEFGSIIFKEFYKKNSKAINDSIKEIGNFKEELKTIMDEFEEAMMQFAIHHDETKEKANRNIDGYFEKLKNKEFRSEKLLNKTTEKNPEIFAAAEEYRLKNIRVYNSAKAVLPHLNQLALLQNIEQKVYELNSEANRFLLSDTQNILYKMIHSDNLTETDNAPFIYEKIGSRLNHIMIDEFQDTSVTQWENLKILVDDCISQENNSALIVGDVKQSIYRWRSGDWRLLNDMEHNYDPSIALAKSLKVNRRSEKNIVDFNNMFFGKAVKYFADILSKEGQQYAEVLKKAYADVSQETEKTEDNGYVKIDFIETGDDYQHEQLEKIYQTITNLKASGVKEKDIAILLRKNKHITLIANYFSQHHPELRIISDEAFKLSSSDAVTIIVEALRNLVQNDDISRAHLVKLYQTSVMEKPVDETALFIHNKEIPDYLPEEYSQGKDELLSLPLYELAERLYVIFQLSKLKEESGYVCAFFDHLLGFVSSSSTNVKDFLKEWDKNISGKSIQSDDINGIRIMSIHKSKGLEFKNVILPFCDWALESDNLIWVQTSDKGIFSKMPLLPVLYSSSLRDTIFCDIYAEEFMQNIVDNLNTLYVAFTRAENNLFIFTRSEKGKKASIFDVVSHATEELGGSIEEGYEYGSLYVDKECTPKHEKTTDEEENKLAHRYDGSIDIAVETFNYPVEFRESNRSNYLFNPDDIEENREKGTLLHNIFSEIEYAEDAERILDRYEEEGFFPEGILTREEAENALKKTFSHPTLLDWFSRKWHVCNERNILLRGGNEETVRFRCDRVVFNDEKTIVIDFKFGKPHLEYEHQVKNYMALLADVGFRNVSGYLWYANEEKLVEVR